MNSVEKRRLKNRRKDKAKLGGEGRLKMSTPEIQGYYTRWVNDVGTRIMVLTQYQDYDFVLDSEIDGQVGDLNVTPGNKDTGSRVRRPVGTDKEGKPIYAYLLKMRKEFRDADIKEKEQALQEREQGIKAGNVADNPNSGDLSGRSYGQVNLN